MSLFWGFFAYNVTKPWSYPLKQAQIITLPPTDLYGRALGLPSHQNGINLSSSGHMTLFHCSRVKSLPYMNTWSMKVFLETTHHLHMYCLRGNAPTSTIKPSHELYRWIFALITDHNNLSISSSLSSTDLDQILVVSALCFVVFFAWWRSMIWPFWNGVTTFLQPQTVPLEMRSYSISKT